MIDRRALWISLFILFAMIAGDFWRLGQLPDWHYIPADGPGNSLTIPVLVLFTPVLALLFVMGTIFSRTWLRSGPKEAVQSWQGWYGRLLLFGTVIMAVAQVFVVARSLGLLQSVDRPTFARLIAVVAGIFMIMRGNMTPKMPWLSMRFRPLDPWQWNRYQRFGGKLAVASGLFMAVGLPLLPIQMLAPTGLGMTLVILVLSYWYPRQAETRTLVGVQARRGLPPCLCPCVEWRQRGGPRSWA